MSKKIITAAAAFVLVIAICVTGTIAFLTATSNEGNAITNTFTASGGLIDPKDPDDDPEDITKNGFYIFETDENGEPTLDGVNYTVIPGKDIAKDPTVRINGKTDVPAYLFIEVVENEFNENLTYAITEDWIGTDLVGRNGGKIYVYKDVVTSYEKDEETVSDFDIGILVDDKIGVGADFAVEDGKEAGSLSFYGYMCQSETFNSAEEAFTACFIAD